ncbi:GNAT family N-acetyltransferase [Chitinibacter fontanus]|uniref:L-ornithine N(alpha)-acyltransferase n=1 Tax=Chitinibacter fontanus TaxID=1737446 RepID=A0A7D5Z6Y5_9NEIS|nr:GNAT family N-acyltransferase [Chitinibacter fontanus]QLI81943.1 GNAT family N-acetyltransferase [Chitinibacter fontanus]
MYLDSNHGFNARRKKLTVTLASNPDQIRAAQALRYKVFAEEMQAKLNCKEPGIDQDLFDAYCEHLVALDEESGEVVGTYRILPPHQARKVGSYYSDTEFDLTRLQHIRSQLVELGRTCVHPNYRSGATIALLWNGLTQYMLKNNYQYMMGCASVSLNDGGHSAASLYRKISTESMAPIEWRVFPRCPLPINALDSKVEIETPALIKGYLRAGAVVCGEPAWDPDFNTADFLMLLPTQFINKRYSSHFAR